MYILSFWTMIQAKGRRDNWFETCTVLSVTLDKTMPFELQRLLLKWVIYSPTRRYV